MKDLKTVAKENYETMENQLHAIEKIAGDAMAADQTCDDRVHDILLDLIAIELPRTWQELERGYKELLDHIEKAED